MAITDADRLVAEQSYADDHAGLPRAVSARYDRRVARIVVALDNGLELSFPPRLAQGLQNAATTDLAVIEVTPSGYGLSWPALDADLSVRALLRGVFGSEAWMEKLRADKAAALASTQAA